MTTPNLVCTATCSHLPLARESENAGWDVDAPLGPWCLTWDIHNPWDDDLTRLKRSVIATWQPVPGASVSPEPIPAKRFKSKLGDIWLSVERQENSPEKVLTSDPDRATLDAKDK